MNLLHSRDATPRLPSREIATVLREVSATNLRALVERLAFPRHFDAERAANERAADLVEETSRGYGYRTLRQGACANVIAFTEPESREPVLLLGAHYDSVPGSPGADDNASAVAVCLECARVLRGRKPDHVRFAFFNREEDGFVGSDLFVDELVSHPGAAVAEAHIFEMVGYRSRALRTQGVPPGLERLPVPGAGDFLALLANRRSNEIASRLLTLAATYLTGTPVLALQTDLGPGQLPGDLLRSDHVPFWLAGLPALMWTDTSNFRNPNYHRASDTPETLDYEFMADCAKLALARILTHS